ncbi:MAG: hypothetical protein FWD59_02545 [Micrococcales bacterium]|nr:hypothetical protein [Micrococcales bacterium]
MTAATWAGVIQTAITAVASLIVGYLGAGVWRKRLKRRAEAEDGLRKTHAALQCLQATCEALKDSEDKDPIPMHDCVRRLVSSGDRTRDCPGYSQEYVRTVLATLESLRDGARACQYKVRSDSLQKRLSLVAEVSEWAVHVFSLEGSFLIKTETVKEHGGDALELLLADFPLSWRATGWWDSWRRP